MQLAPSTAAQWAGAAATTIAVLVALFKDEWLRYLRRPRLNLYIEPKQPDCQLVPSLVFGPQKQLLWQGDIYWLRLWIKNEGRGRAEQVQVFLSKLHKKDAKHEFAPVANFVPMNLRWSHPRDGNNPEIFAPGISQKFGKHCDLCSISDPNNPTDVFKGHEGECIANLALEVYPNNETHRLPPGDYRLEIMIGAANAKPITKSLLLNLTGQWSADPETMLRDYVGVRLS
jgi:hypothetical protein